MEALERRRRQCALLCGKTDLGQLLLCRHLNDRTPLQMSPPPKKVMAPPSSGENARHLYTQGVPIPVSKWQSFHETERGRVLFISPTYPRASFQCSYGTGVRIWSNRHSVCPVALSPGSPATGTPLQATDQEQFRDITACSFSNKLSNT